MANNTVNIRMICPLLWFYLGHEERQNFQPFSLVHGAKLVEINKNVDVIRYLEKASTISDYEKGIIKDFSNYAIVYEYTATDLEARDLASSKPYREAEELKGLLKMALGLAKGSNLSFPTFHIRQDTDSRLVAMAYDDRPAKWQYSGVQFANFDLETARLLAERIEPLATEKHNRIMNACVYFETGRLSTEYIVRFIMMVSALESLFNSSTDHITETVSIRCASLLTSDQEEGLDYYRSVKNVYRMRSYLVHGQDIPKKFKSEREQRTLIANAEFFARESLLHIFRNGLEDAFALAEADFNEYFVERLLTSQD